MADNTIEEQETSRRQLYVLPQGQCPLHTPPLRGRMEEVVATHSINSVHAYIRIIIIAKQE